MLEGAGAAMVWVVYGGYVKSLTKKYNEEDIEGKYFSLLNAICFSNSLLGNLITTFCIDLFSNEIYFLILTILGIISLLFCQFFVTDLPHPDEQAE